MSKFGSRYGAHAARQRSYLDYNRMKEYLHKHGDEELHIHVGDSSISQPPPFFDVFFTEMERANQAYVNMLSSIHGLFENFELLAVALETEKSRDKRLRKVCETTLKRNANHIYTKIVKLENFRLLNRTAAIKILKKYDKPTGRHAAMSAFELCMVRVNAMEIGHGKELIEVKDLLTLLYADLFCDGELEEANLRLALSKNNVNLSVLQWVMFKGGVILSLIVILLRNHFLDPRISMLFLLGSDPSVFVYAAVGALIAYRWFWGFNVYMWDKAGVDYVLAINLDPNKHMPTYADIYSDASTLTILYLLNILMFHLLRFYHTQQSGEGLASVLISISEYAYLLPVALVAGTLVRAIGSYAQPTSYGVFSTYVASRLARTPFLKVFLRDNFAANILTSFARVWSAVLDSGCYFRSGAFWYAADPTNVDAVARFTQCSISPEILDAKLALRLLPLVIRFLQCLRQRRDFLILTASPSTTASAAVALSPAVDYSLEPRLEDELEQSIEAAYNTVAASNDDASFFGVNPAAEHRQEAVSTATVMKCEEGGSSSAELTETVGVVQSMDWSSEVGMGEVSSITCALPLLAMCDAALSRIFYRTCGVWKTIWIWPHSFNALRYFLSISVAYFGARPPQNPFSVEYMSWYIPLYVISTLYSCYWDVIVDYQLFQPDSEVPFLRKKLFYHKMINFYYFVIIVNPVLRFLWTLSFTPYGSHPLFAVFEIARRSFWAILRMEVAYIQELKRRRSN